MIRKLDENGKKTYSIIREPATALVDENPEEIEGQQPTPALEAADTEATSSDDTPSTAPQNSGIQAKPLKTWTITKST